MGKASELDDSIRPLTAAQLAARKAAAEIADDDVEVTLNGEFVKRARVFEAPRIVQPARTQTWD